MVEVTTDERGRITIPESARDRYGDEYRLVQLEGAIKLVPVPDDPLDALQAAASEELASASLAELRDAARPDST
mgnify:CR=1 FL=1